MSNLRTDGTWTIYQVEAWNLKYSHRSTNQYARWFVPNLARVTKYPWSSTALEKRPRCIREDGASGDCWQQTGNDGFLDPELGKELLAFCREHSDGKHKFRLVKRVLSRKTTTVRVP